MKKFKIDQFVMYQGEMMLVFNRDRFNNVYTLINQAGSMLFGVAAAEMEALK